MAVVRLYDVESRSIRHKLSFDPTETPSPLTAPPTLLRDEPEDD
jgi:hypothetical protein